MSDYHDPTVTIPPGAPTPERLAEFVEAIESGRLAITRRGEPIQLDWRDVVYDAADGSVFVVFIDGGEWDYFDSISLAGFPPLEFEQLVEHAPDIGWHRPTNRVARTIYGTAE